MSSVCLQCLNCDWQTLGNEEEIARRLRKVGFFRRAPNPPEELLREILAANLSSLLCDACGRPGLTLVQQDEFSCDDDWQQAVVCEVCKQPIPLERMQVLPGAKRCVGCQDSVDRGEELVEPDFCPKCGALLELRVGRGGGATRYKFFCTGDSPCRL